MILNSLFYLTFFLFSLGHLGRVSFFGQQINIYLYELLTGLILAVLVTRYKFIPVRENFKKFKIIFIFLGYLLAPFLLSASFFKSWENFVGFLYFLRIAVYFLYFFYLTHHLKQKSGFLKVLVYSLSLFAFFTVLFSAGQYFLYPDLRNLIYGGWDPHLYRMFGTFFDTSVAGGIYGLVFLTLFFKGKDLVKSRLILLILLAIFLFFIVLTFSRSLYMTLLSVVLLSAVVRRNYRKLFILIFFFLLIMILSPKPFGEGVNLLRLFSVQSRLEDYQNAIKIWSKNPVLGIGYNRIRYEKVRLNIIETTGADLTHSGASFHSSFLIILVTSGIIGLVLFIPVLMRLAEVNEFSRYIIIFLSLFSLSDNILLHPFVLFLFLSLIALFKINPSRK